MGYTRSEMADGGRKAGFGDVSERLVTDWAGMGLLDQADRVGRGKGGGTGARYEWPDNQLDLFLALLSKRSQVKRVQGLCVIPVAVWLYLGTNAVPLRQARVTLQTWWQAAGEVGRLGRSQKAARVVVDAFAPKSRSDTKTRLREAVSDSIFQGRFDGAQILPLVSKLLQDTQHGTWGPFAFTPNETVRGMQAMVEAINRYNELDDEIFEAVRERQRYSMHLYMRDYPQLVRHPTFGSWFENPDLQFLFNNSCHHLLLGLGLTLLSLDEGAQLQPIPSIQWRTPFWDGPTFMNEQL